MNKILVFGMTENPGGVESVIMNYYRNIDRTKIQFDFLCNSYEKIAYEDEILKLGGKTIHFPARSKDYFGYKRKLEIFFKEHAKEYAAIWVNVCSLANIDYLKIAKKYGIKKRIIHSHNSQNMDGKLRGYLHQYNKKHIDAYATDFWACSEDAAKWFYDEPILEKCVFIHNAIDVDKMKFDPAARQKIRSQLRWEDCYILGNIGRLHFQKNQSFILDVFAELLQSKQEARLVLVGQGEDEGMLKDKISKLCIGDKVYMAGLQSNPSEWLSAFDLFLFPSLFEGLSVVAMEAQANGVPVLASKGAIPSEVVINKNFMLYDLKDGAEEWSRRILSMMELIKREEPVQIKNNFVAAGYEITHEENRLERLLVE